MDFTSDYPAMPLMVLDDDQQDFDYGAFLQEDDADYMAEDSSASASTNNLGITPPGQSPTGAGPSTGTVRSASEIQRQKQRLERRGHTKSRRGCFNCKRRRIKCQETRPACGHCVKTGLNCEYPAAPQVVHQPLHQIPLFSLQDMRFFQHFLINCYPHHPIGAESIWTHEIPCLSEKYEYLMHAILGFAASDLSVQKDPSLLASAMNHRLKAIKAIKKTLSDVPRADTFEEGNAMMATCFALTFQSVLLDDGMVEYMTFIRGIIIVAIQMYIKGAKLIFGPFLGDKQVDVLQPLLEKVPLIEHTWAAAAITAIEGLGALCQHPIEKQYHERILDMAMQLQVSSWRAYKAMSQHYGWWMMLPHEQFRQIIDPSNQVCVLLASHWIALKQIMAVITETEWRAGGEAAKKQGGDIEIGIIRWLKYLNGMVDSEHIVYNQWPMWVEAQLKRDVGFFGKTR
ncbi:C6 zinc finger protein [Coniochaeta ligniaria NRRL 30616]|uniref:C6 zinc finger protein n=1 Tax=Coniochaeta ligniaria NRRL 30616 TaxID=1408157 RepID=A0A1J7JIA6_9PEZI|nr:C6 zinc finger protein [Coniochaeta ligniaria NRRL 30616]